MPSKYTVMAIAKNEGLFLVEWVAHHLAIGFQEILIATNDCEDGSDNLIDLMSCHFPVTRIENSEPLAELTVQQRGNRRCLEHTKARDASWVMHIDIDEFLNIRNSTGRIEDFLAAFEQDDAVAIAWRIFGDGGRRNWAGGMVTDAFCQCERAISIGCGHKSIFRPDVFGETTPHMPKDPKKSPEELRVVNAIGQRLDVQRHYKSRGTAYILPLELLTWEGACINHYMIKSWDLSYLKLIRGDANGRGVKKRIVGNPEFERHNRNEAMDLSIWESQARRLEMFDRIMSHPEIVRQHHACTRWFFEAKEKFPHFAPGN
jgi:hypothetical protein